MGFGFSFTLARLIHSHETVQARAPLVLSQTVTSMYAKAKVKLLSPCSAALNAPGTTSIHPLILLVHKYDSVFPCAHIKFAQFTCNYIRELIYFTPVWSFRLFGDRVQSIKVQSDATGMHVRIIIIMIISSTGNQRRHDKTEIAEEFPKFCSGALRAHSLSLCEQ